MQRDTPLTLAKRPGMSLAKQYMEDRDNPKTLAEPEKVQEFDRNGKHVIECVWSHWLGTAERQNTIHGKIMWQADGEEANFHTNFNPDDPQGEEVARARIARSFDEFYVRV